MSAGGEQVEVEDGEDREDRFNEGFPSDALLGVRSMHAVQKCAGVIEAIATLFVGFEALGESAADEVYGDGLFAMGGRAF